MRSYIFKILLILAIGLSLAQVWAHDVKFEINPKTLKAGEKGVVTATLSIPDGMGQSYDPEDLDYFFLRSEHPELSFGKTLYPKGYKSTEFGFKYAGSVTLSLPFSVKGTAKPGNKSLEAEMGYNLCFDDGNCEIPTSKKGKLQFTIAADAAVQENTGGTPELETPQEEAIAEPEPEPKSAIQAQATEETNSAEESTSDPLTILKYMLFALLGGLILNVTPCVLPILPIRLMSMVNQAQRGQGKVLVHSFVYTVGAMLSFGILAGIFIALRSAGEAQGWGFQNQNPYFTVGLMSVVYIFALSLLGVFVISAPGMNTATQASSKGGYSGSFFGGVFAFLMAISCTGPFLGLALPFAFKLTSVLLLLFFLIIGLGFALPFILVGFFPKFLKIIPKPGEWMNIFKEVMGFVLLYIVFTQLKTIYVLTGGEYLLNMVWYLIVVGFGIWLYGRFVRTELSKATQWIFTLLALAIVVYAGFSFIPIKEDMNKPDLVTESQWLKVPSPIAPKGWYKFSPALMDSLMTAQVPVFLDFGATWCKNCTYNKKRVLHTEKIMQAFAEKGVTLVYGDFTKQDPEILAWIQKYGGAGVPFDRLYLKDQDPVRFNEIISDKDIYEALELIK